MDFAQAQSILSTKAGVQFDPGLTDAEFSRIEKTFGFEFPPDLHEFLSLGLPVSKSWPNWRGSDEPTLRHWLNAPFDGICFDTQQSEFWLPEWGTRPPDHNAAIHIARQAVLQAPTLIPVFGHRFIPATPHQRGNPVFSVHQTDIIHYGSDLLNYLHNEFYYEFGVSQYTFASTPRKIPFWSQFTEL